MEQHKVSRGRGLLKEKGIFSKQPLDPRGGILHPRGQKEKRKIKERTTSLMHKRGILGPGSLLALEGRVDPAQERRNGSRKGGSLFFSLPKKSN